MSTRNLFAALVLLSACAATNAVLPPSRVLCYADADRRAQARVELECKGADSFKLCKSHDSIMAELRSAEESCK